MKCALWFLSQEFTTTAQRLLDHFSDLASTARCSGSKTRLLEGNPGPAYAQAVEADRVHVLAVQAPAGKALSESLLQVLMACKCGVLVCRNS
jgi:hypothetical protein